MMDRLYLRELLSAVNIREGEGRDEDGEYYNGSTLTLFTRALKRGLVDVPDPLGWSRVTHLHYRHIKGNWIWVLSVTRNAVCKTPRCVPVEITKERYG